MPDRQTHVIVGAGLAGAKAAEALRDEGFDGRLVLVGAEPEPPYERPPLSKGYLRGECPRESTRVLPDDFYGEHAIELRTATTVEGIDLAERELALSDGERLGYDKLLLTTGAEPRRLAVPGSELEGVHYLRDLADADLIAARLHEGGRVVVVGGGWIGCEVAASARQKGLDVTLVDRAAVPLERVLGREVGEVYAQLHRDRGVELLGAAAVERLEGAGGVEQVRLADGRVLATDFVIVGIGVRPRVQIAEQAGIRVDNGIVVDERLATSVDGVFAAGDVANAFHPLYGRRLRVEHWANARVQGAVAALSMLGEPAGYEPLPYFFSDQYDLGMEYSGYAPSWDRVVFRGDPGDGGFIAFWLDRERVVAAMNANVWEVTEPIQTLIRSGQPVDPAALRDPDTPLDELAGTAAGATGGRA